MPVLQTSIRDSRLKSLAVTCYQRSQQREMNEYFITSGCRTGVAKRTPISRPGRDHRSALCVEDMVTEGFVVEPYILMKQKRWISLRTSSRAKEGLWTIHKVRRYLMLGAETTCKVALLIRKGHRSIDPTLGD